MTSPNAAGCAAHLNQLQQHECYYYSSECVQGKDAPAHSEPLSERKSIDKRTIVENGRVVVKELSNQ